MSHRLLHRAAALVCVAGAAACTLAEETVAIRAARIHTVSDGVIENGVILIRDGKIAAVGKDVPIPAGSRTVGPVDGVVTPGLIDAMCALDFEVPQVAPQRFYYGHKQTCLPDCADPAHATPRRATLAHPHESGMWGPLVDVAQRNAPDGPYAHCADVAEPHVCGPACAGPQSAAEASELLAPGPSVSLTWAEHAYEVTPHVNVADSISLISRDFVRLARSGVTTVYVTPDSASVIGARGAIVRTGGPLAQRFVRRADAVKATMGDDPSSRGRSNQLPPTYGPPPSVFTRRPTTRMGVEFVFRKAFYDARRAAAGLTLHGADQPPAQAVPVLQEVLAGRVPLRIQARMQHDIHTALRLAREFDLKFTLEEATEAWGCLEPLRAAQVPVIFGPIFDAAAGYRAFSGEADEPRLNTARLLAESGIPFALTAQEQRDEDGLVRQGMYAVRYGLPADAALAAITRVPAEMLGIADQCGSVRTGLRADLVIWSGEPFDAATRPLAVVIGGRVVFEE